MEAAVFYKLQVWGGGNFIFKQKLGVLVWFSFGLWTTAPVTLLTLIKSFHLFYSRNRIPPVCFKDFLQTNRQTDKQTRARTHSQFRKPAFFTNPPRTSTKASKAPQRALSHSRGSLGFNRLTQCSGAGLGPRRPLSWPSSPRSSRSPRTRGRPGPGLSARQSERAEAGCEPSAPGHFVELLRRPPATQCSGRSGCALVARLQPQPHLGLPERG